MPRLKLPTPTLKNMLHSTKFITHWVNTSSNPDLFFFRFLYIASVGSTSAALNLSPTAALLPLSTTTTTTTDVGKTEEQQGKQGSPAHKTVQAYARPLQELVSVAKEGEVEGLHSRVNALQARAIRLTSIAETAAGAVRHNPKLMK